MLRVMRSHRFPLSPAASQKDVEAASAPMASPPLTPPLLPNATVFHAPSSPVTPGTPVTPSAPSPVETPGISECVVCMETAVFNFLTTCKACFLKMAFDLNVLLIVCLSGSEHLSALWSRLLLSGVQQCIARMSSVPQHHIAACSSLPWLDPEAVTLRRSPHPAYLCIIH